jgi:hypothetical protein
MKRKAKAPFRLSLGRAFRAAVRPLPQGAAHRRGDKDNQRDSG